jgi:carbon storage regulator CsrA
MLVLTRKRGEQIVIGRKGQKTVIEGELTVNVLRVIGQHVRLGIDADRWIPINRREVIDREEAA